MARYVVTEDARWKVVGEILIDDKPGYDLERWVLVRKKVDGKWHLSRKKLTLAAFESDCLPDNHEPVRVWRDDDAVVRFFTKQKIVKVGEPGRKPRYQTSLKGILLMCGRAEANRKALEKAWRKRTGRRGQK